MVILLDGTSAMARTAIAESIVERIPTWKHLSLEVIEGAMPEDIESEDYREQHVEIVSRCAAELEKDGLHLVLSLPESHKHLTLLRDALAPRCIAVHIGEGHEDEYDYTFDSSISSVKDIVTFLEHLIDSIPEAA
jgi:hypothetical protein